MSNVKALTEEVNRLGGLAADLRAENERLRISISDGSTWIPVSERLPEVWVRVLVWSQFKADNTHIHLDSVSPDRGWWWGGVTHWMPLPEAPK